MASLSLDFGEKMKENPTYIDPFGYNWLMLAYDHDIKMFEKLLHSKNLYAYITTLFHKNDADRTIFDIVRDSEKTKYEKELLELAYDEIKNKPSDKINVNIKINKDNETLFLASLRIEFYDLTEKLLDNKDCKVNSVTHSRYSFLGRMYNMCIVSLTPQCIKICKKVIEHGYNHNTSLVSGHNILTNLTSTLDNIDSQTQEMIKRCELIDIVLDNPDVDVNKKPEKEINAVSALIRFYDPKVIETVKKLVSHPKFNPNIIINTGSYNSKELTLLEYYFEHSDIYDTSNKQHDVVDIMLKNPNLNINNRHKIIICTNL